MQIGKSYFKLSLAICFGLLSSAKTIAIETLSAKELKYSCVEYIASATSPKGVMCDAYLQGFVSGSSHITVADAEQSEFTQRAIRNRAPGGSIAIDSLKGARYCLPSDINIPSLAAQIATTELGKADRLASGLMTQVLKTHYRC
ncbi:hypothetical protein [Zhongshania borealis]|uniref:Rap1a immunity protein domain-containing protein n=1 Tax=Zhongshania borealis TaxID=889488 RepID=A0ABP7WSL9_9GAMM